MRYVDSVNHDKNTVNDEDAPAPRFTLAIRTGGGENPGVLYAFARALSEAVFTAE
ncbi:MAG: hypothetical protein LBK08_03445 [Treponema sp.]|nr:hypothetical protein [Treponema sp.]